MLGEPGPLRAVPLLLRGLLPAGWGTFGSVAVFGGSRTVSLGNWAVEPGMKMIAMLAHVRRRQVADAESPRREAGDRGGRPGRVARLLVPVAAACLAAASCGGSTTRSVGSLRVRPCTVDGLAARCGSLIVAQDRLTGKGRTIPVRFVVFPAVGPGRAPDRWSGSKAVPV